MAEYGRTIVSADFRIRRGNIEVITFAFQDGGVALNLTGKTVEFRAKIGDTVYIDKATGGSGFTMASPATGVATLTLSAAETRALPESTSQRPISIPYEVENITDQKTLLEGNLIPVGGINDD